jgi:hypothetical protein
MWGGTAISGGTAVSVWYEVVGGLSGMGKLRYLEIEKQATADPSPSAQDDSVLGCGHAWQIRDWDWIVADAEVTPLGGFKSKQ